MQVKSVKKASDTKKDISWHFILDPNADDESMHYLSSDEAGFYDWPLYLNTYDENLVLVGPHMVNLNIKSRFYRWVFNKMETVAMGVIIACPAGAEEKLYEHLQKILEYKLPSKRRGLFRYYDPRMLYGLGTYNDDMVKYFLLGPALFFESWEAGRAIPITIENQLDSNFLLPENYFWPDDLIEHMFKEAWIHSIIGSIEGKSGEVFGSKPLPEAYQLLDEGAKVITSYGFNSFNDLVDCAIITARYGLEIWHRTDVISAMASAEAGSSLRGVWQSINVQQ